MERQDLFTRKIYFVMEVVFQTGGGYTTLLYVKVT